jgi:hypothetical protein
MQQLAGLSEIKIKPSHDYKYIYDYFSDNISEYPELYGGLKEAIYSPQFIVKMNQFVEEFREYYNENPEMYEDESEDEYIQQAIYDFGGRVILEVWGERFIKNLIDAGFTYDATEDDWTLPDAKYADPVFNRMDMTSYGVIWRFWYDLDTSEREGLGEYFADLVADIAQKYSK